MISAPPAQKETHVQESNWSQEERDDVTAMLSAKVAQDPIAEFFAFAHLKQPLADVSFTFARQALFILENVPRNAERTVALRKLLESKDAAVRARFARPTAQPLSTAVQAVIDHQRTEAAPASVDVTSLL